MLTIINKGLFEISRPKSDGENNETDFYTSPLVNKEVSKGNRKPFIKLKTPITDTEDIKHIISVRENEFGKRNVLIRATGEAKRNANIIVVAFPFNGLIKPIEPSKEFRVYKGLIASSDSYNITHNGRTYKKILYLVIEANMTLFNNETEREPIKIELSAVSYDKRGEEKDTINNVLTITIDKDNTSFDNTINEIEPIDMNVYKGMQLYQQFELKPYVNNKKPQSQSYNKEKSGAPIQPRKPNVVNNTYKNKPKTLDSMIESAGLYDNDALKGSKDNRSNRKPKNKKRNNYN